MNLEYIKPASKVAFYTLTVSHTKKEMDNNVCNSINNNEILRNKITVTDVQKKYIWKKLKDTQINKKDPMFMDWWTQDWYNACNHAKQYIT